MYYWFEIAQVDRDFVKLKKMTRLSQYIQLFHDLKKTERRRINPTIERFKERLKCIISSRSHKLILQN